MEWQLQAEMETETKTHEAQFQEVLSLQADQHQELYFAFASFLDALIEERTQRDALLPLGGQQQQQSQTSSSLQTKQRHGGGAGDAFFANGLAAGLQSAPVPKTKRTSRQSKAGPPQAPLPESLEASLKRPSPEDRDGASASSQTSDSEGQRSSTAAGAMCDVWVWVFSFGFSSQR